MNTPRTPDAEGLKDTNLQQWTGAASGFRKWHPRQLIMGRALTEALVQAAHVKPGMKVLDLACGTGNPALELAAAVGPGGHVTATDLVPEMVTAAQENPLEQGLTNITFQQADAQALPFPDQTFDLVTCRHGVMFFVTVQTALQEIHRVLKPGSRVVFTAFGPMEQNPDHGILQRVLWKYVKLPPSQPEVPAQFKFAQAGTLSEELRKAGFLQVEEEARTVPYPWPGTVHNFWEFNQEVRPSVRRLMGTLQPQHWEQANTEVLAVLAPYYDGKQLNFTAGIVLASGVRPGITP